jgi:hypothetical protein
VRTFNGVDWLLRKLCCQLQEAPECADTDVVFLDHRKLAEPRSKGAWLEPCQGLKAPVRPSGPLINRMNRPCFGDSTSCRKAAPLSLRTLLTHS